MARRVTAPVWIAPPRLAKLRGSISPGAQPGERAVEIRANGKAYAAIVPTETVEPADLPDGVGAVEGTIQVMLVAETDDGYLAQLPAAPINGNQRIEVAKSALVQ